VNKYVNDPDRRICFYSMSFTGRDRNAPLVGAPETVVRLGDDKMPFEAGSFVWKGGKENLGDIPLFLSGGKAFIAAHSGLYTFADALSWCERMSDTGVQWQKPTPEDFQAVKHRTYLCNVDAKACRLDDDFVRYLRQNGNPDLNGKSILVNHDDVARLKDGSSMIDFSWNKEITRARKLNHAGTERKLTHEREQSLYRPICVARNLGDGDIQATVRVVARGNLLAKCATSSKLAAPVKQAVSLTRGEFEKTADFERRKKDAERQAEQNYQQALKRHAQAQQTANAACEKEKRAQTQGWSIQYSNATFNLRFPALLARGGCWVLE
jgi:hypothetical protein